MDAEWLQKFKTVLSDTESHIHATFVGSNAFKLGAIGDFMVDFASQTAAEVVSPETTAAEVAISPLRFKTKEVSRLGLTHADETSHTKVAKAVKHHVTKELPVVQQNQDPNQQQPSEESHP